MGKGTDGKGPRPEIFAPGWLSFLDHVAAEEENVNHQIQAVLVM